jgi:hypothetical protein
MIEQEREQDHVNGAPAGVHPAELISREKGTHMSVFAPPSLPSPVSAQPAKPKRVWYLKKRWWAVGVVVVLVGASAALGGGTKSKTATSNTSAPLTTGTPATTTTAAATAAPVATAAPATTAATPAVSDVTPHLSPLLFGTATPNLPAGDAGKVTVVQTSNALGESFYHGAYNIVVRNNTDKTVSNIGVTGTLRSSGALVGSGDDQGFEPPVLQPGEAAFGLVFFENADSIPADATFDFTVTSSTYDAGDAFSHEIQVTEANRVPGASSNDHDTVVGSFTNNTDKTLDSASATVHCFDGDRYLDDFDGHFSGELAPGATGTFSATLFENCPSFLVSASGTAF